MKKAQPILVIGSAHIDILADYTKETKDHIDKIGTLRMTTGGSGYNIAINLKNHNYPVALWTHLKTNSLSGDIIKKELSNRGVDTRYVFFNKELTEAGFVAHRLEGKLMSAVSAISINHAKFNLTKLSQAIRRSAIIVIDCNLSTKQIREIIKIARGFQKRIFVCAVSESKAYRALTKIPGVTFNYEVLSINSREAEKFLNWNNIRSSQKVKNMCRFFRSKNVVVTNGKKGYSIFQNDGNRSDYGSHEIKIIKSELGAGDALLAAICAYFSEKTKISWDDCDTYIFRFVEPVLSVEEATINPAVTPFFPIH